MQNLICFSISRACVFVCVLGMFFCNLLQAQPPAEQIKMTDPNTGETMYAVAHEVKKGETLYALQRRYGTKVAEIKRLNQLTSDLIKPGQILAVSSSQAGYRTADSGTRPRSLYDQYTDKPFDATEVDLTDGTRSGGSLPYRNSYRVARSTEIRTVPRQYDPTLAYYHEVEAGEDLYQIADRFGISVQEIQERNGIVDVDSGQTILIPPREDAYVSTGEGAELEEDKSYDFVYKNSEDDLLAESSLFATSEGSNLRNMEPTLPRGSANEESELPLDLLLRSDTELTLGKIKEEGKYGPFAGSNPTEAKFYGLHKELDKNEVVKMLIPNTAGYIEVTIIGKLPPNSKLLLALSPSCIELLDKADAGNMVTIFHD